MFGKLASLFGSKRPPPSWMWQEPDDAVRSHVAHAVVTAPPGGDPVGEAWNVTRLAAAMLKAGAGVAVSSGNGRQVHTASIRHERSKLVPGRDAIVLGMP